MSRRAPTTPPFAAHFHLLGQVDYEDCLTAQKRLAYDAATRGDGRLVALLCEHPPLITVGRRGSRDQLQLTGAELAERALTVRYVARGGGCLLHAPGQLAIYVITQLDWHGWTVGEFVRRFQAALRGVLNQAGLQTRSLPGQLGLWGQHGVLASLGVAVKYGVTSHGAFLNVDPDLRSMQRVEAVAAAEYAALTRGEPHWPRRPIHSSLLSETSQVVKMSDVQAAVGSHLATAFGCLHAQLHPSHPLLPELSGSPRRESAA